jgi:hypothetical protein
MLSVASKNGNLDVVSLLLGRDDGVDLCKADRMAQLYIAAPEIGHTKVVETLLERAGANANLATLRKRMTPQTSCSIRERVPGHCGDVDQQGC